LEKLNNLKIDYKLEELLSNVSAVSWREEVNFLSDDDEFCFVIEHSTTPDNQKRVFFLSGFLIVFIYRKLFCCLLQMQNIQVLNIWD
jgi:hypothetical protein